jgi:hypothetical protein
MNKELEQEKLETFLKTNPLLHSSKGRMEQSLLSIGNSKIKRLEYLIDLNIGHLSILSDKIVKLKKRYKIKEI